MGGGGHGHGHEPPYKIPDYRVYKVENVPQLMALRRTLAAHGLKDPWLRNEVWKYGTHSTRDKIVNGVFRGWRYGLVAAIFTSALTFYFEANEDHHGHGHAKSGH